MSTAQQTSPRGFREIRDRLGMTQAEISTPLGVTQGSVSFYETGTILVPPAVAAKLIDLAKSRNLEISYDSIYSAVHGDASEAKAAA